MPYIAILQLSPDNKTKPQQYTHYICNGGNTTTKFQQNQITVV